MTIERSNDSKSFSEFEHEGWEVNSAGYERHWARLTRQTVGATLDSAGVRSGARVLDVCTGPGMLAKAALERGAKAVGLDFSKQVVAIARRNVPGAEFHEGDAQDLPFEDDSFDAVVCGYGIIHVPEPDRALSEMHRVLKTGGRLAASVWEAPKPNNGFGLLFGAIKAHGDLSVPLPHGPDFFQFSESADFASAFEATGFRDLTVRRIDQFWEVDEPLGVMTAVLEGAVRARGLLLAQTDDVRAAISAALAQGMEQYRRPDGIYRVPMPALVGAGTK